jgi:Tn3 transposase DDE domain-containing protein
VNTNLIKENWDDMLRLAGSLKLGVVQATRAPSFMESAANCGSAIARGRKISWVRWASR